MPERTFDRHEFRKARRAANKSQAAVAAELGVKEPAVAKWESGRTKQPPPEKLPQMAVIVNLPLDVLAPRAGRRNLADLRCDAGLTLTDTLEELRKTFPKLRTSVVVRNAETKVRQLAEHYVEPLADAYGVEVEVLLAAQERTWGNDVPEPTVADEDLPRTLSGKMQLLIDQTYGGELNPPSDGDIARTINTMAGKVVISESGVGILRSGGADNSPVSTEILDGLAAAYHAPTGFFYPGEEAIARDFTSTVKRAARLRGVTLAARGGEAALNSALLKTVDDLLDSIEKGELPGISAEELD
ncbi:helix-turn-helix domain-containing protein [Streptomyces sp. NPDC015125]|uniref:helix-turn-helix domain-containing protein n=1 Tax=Streptomyces sp. NPDC015125 TaxID=3364938 RepID=UPI0036FEF1B1